MVIRPLPVASKAKHPVPPLLNTLLRSLLSLALLAALYSGMITAFHLLNLPSTRSVLGGLALLLLLAAAGPLALRLIWKKA